MKIITQKLLLVALALLNVGTICAESVNTNVFKERNQQHTLLYKGGDMNSFINDLKNEVEIPAYCHTYEVECEITMSFTVTKRGKISNIIMGDTPFKLLSENVQKWAEKCKGWHPDVRNGKKVDTELFIKIPFSFISNESKGDRKAPRFMGVNSSAFGFYLQKHIVLPPSIEESMTEETSVSVKFTIMKNGKVGFAKIIGAADPQIAKIVLLAIYLSNRDITWTPGMLNGKPIDVSSQLRLAFGKVAE